MKATLKIFLLLPALFLSLTTFAQTNLGFKLGLQNSGVVSDLQFGDFQPTKFIASPQAGLLLEFNLGQHFALQPELNYTTRGFRIQEGFGFDLVNIPLEVGVRVETKVNYLNLPLLAKAKFGNDKITGYVMAGPEVGYALNGNIKTKAHAIVDIKLFEQKLNLSQLGYERWDIGATAGAGVAFNTGFGEVFVDARYYRGFSDLVQLPIIDVPLKNQGLQVSIGYQIPLQAKQTGYAKR